MLIVFISPFYFLAGSIGPDEYIKTGVGAAQFAGIIAIYKLWQSYQQSYKRCPECNRKMKDCICP